MKMKTRNWIATLLGCLIALPVLAAGSDKAEGNARPVPKEMADFTSTGEVQKCLSFIRIDRTKVWDDWHILFKMRNGDFWLNALPQKCSRLGREGSFMYKNAINQLCNMDIITVLDTSTQMKGPSCSLGDFQKVEKKGQTEE